MKNLFAIIFNFIKSKVITQDFELEGYSFLAPIPFTTNYDVWYKGLKPIIRYRGKEWKEKRLCFFLERHGMTLWEKRTPTGTFTFAAKVCYKAI